MKLLSVGLLALVALCSGTTTTTPPPSPDCQLSGIISQSEFWTAWRKVEKCAHSGMTPTLSKELGTARDLESLVTIFDEYCQRSNATVLDCLREQSSEYELCPNEKLSKVFNVHRHQMETALDVVCEGGSGRRLATLWYGLGEIFDNATNPLNVDITKCALGPLLAAETVTKNKVDVPSTVFILHQQLSTFKKCFSQINIDARFREVSELIFDELIRKDKCFHPQEETIVPCSAIDSTLLAHPTLCSAKSAGPVTLYDALEEDAAMCYGSGVTNFVREHNDASADLNGLREDFKTFCSRTLNATSCLDKTTAFSEMCLNDTQRGEFVVMRASMTSALESACWDNGKRLADVMIEIHRLKRDSAGEAHPVTECLDVVMATRKQTPSLSFNLRFYRELEIFKGCFVEKLRASITSVSSATTVIDEIRGKVSCLNPEDGSTVLCETLSNNL